MQLLQQDPKKRLDSLEALKQESLMADVDWESVEAVKVQPGFVPPVSESSNSLSGGSRYSIYGLTFYLSHQHCTSKHPILMYFTKLHIAIII